ncbi:TonB-dependent receptor domain-containing protein [Pedobacter antarcticus]|uniref:TonB-dependent receptor domain-containing protein n=1 Tax=Pedobacter antarcticus TaxID=34086 RepID=UPI001C5A00E4|nr:TonB-dependent receptor [Pedobacter antarcticus]
MKKFLLLLLIFGIMQQTASAQFGLGGAQKSTITGKITAVIVDSLTQTPIDYATVSLIRIKDKKSVNGAITDAKGKVVLQNISPDKYQLSIGFMGYKSKTIDVETTPGKPDLNAGTISISGTQSNLKEVAIVGTTPLIENKIDKVVYNAEQDVTTAGGNAGDVMRKVPMVTVDIEGNPSLRGSSAVRVLINGKPSGTMSNSVADALKMIPAEEIKSVEVITSPSAKYDAEGSGGIINIITKKKTAQGINGNASVAGGTRQNNANFGLNAKKGRLGFNSNFGGQYAIPQDTRVIIQNDNYATDRAISQIGTTKAKRYGFSGSAGLDYDINGYNSLSTNIKYNEFSMKTNGAMDVLERLGATSDTYRRPTDNDNGFSNIDWSADYRRTSKKEGEEFTVSGQASFGRNTARYNTFREAADGTISDRQDDNNTGKNNEYTIQSDYVYPFSKDLKLETGMKGIFRNIRSKYEDTNQDFDYNQNVGAAYGVLNIKLAKTLDLKGGLRAEYTDISSVSGNSINSSNNYFNLFPSAILSKTLKGNSTLKLSYNKRMQRPSLFYLNPFLNQADPENKSQGNPDLTPEISDLIELGYSTFIKGSVINASVFYRNTRDVIESLFDPNQKLTSYYNIGTNESFGANVFASYNPLPKWTLMGNFSMNTYKLTNSQTKVSTDLFVNYTVFGRSAISFKGGWNTEIFAVYNAAKRTFQGETGAMVFYGGAFKKDIMKKKATVGINVLNVFSRDLHIRTENSGPQFLQSTNVYYPLRSFGVNFSYKFGKMNFNPSSKKKKGVNNDDLKQGETGGGMGGGIQQ